MSDQLSESLMMYSLLLFCRLYGTRSGGNATQLERTRSPRAVQHDWSTRNTLDAKESAAAAVVPVITDGLLFHISTLNVLAESPHFSVSISLALLISRKSVVYGEKGLILTHDFLSIMNNKYFFLSLLF